MKFIDGEKLRLIRKESGMTQVQMAERLGISRETVINIEKCHMPTIENLSLALVNKWGRICRGCISAVSRRNWQSYLKKLLDLD